MVFWFTLDLSLLLGCVRFGGQWWVEQFHFGICVGIIKVINSSSAWQCWANFWFFLFCNPGCLFCTKGWAQRSEAICALVFETHLQSHSLQGTGPVLALIRSLGSGWHWEFCVGCFPTVCSLGRIQGNGGPPEFCCFGSRSLCFVEMASVFSCSGN